MKLYTFTHRGLSPSAKGIQALHATVGLFKKYPFEDSFAVHGIETFPPLPAAGMKACMNP